MIIYRGVIKGKAGKAAALPKFSDTITLSQPGGVDQCSVNQYLGTVKYRFILQILILHFFTENIQTFIQMSSIKKYILIHSVFFSIIRKTFKNIFFLYSNVKKCFCFVYLLKMTKPCLIVASYWKCMACNAILACCC